MPAAIQQLLFEHLPYLFYGILAIAVLTIIFILVSVFRSKAHLKRIEALVTISGGIGSLGAIVLGWLNAIHPLAPVAAVDEGAAAIDRFYGAIDTRKYGSAFDLMHPARLAEIAEARRNASKNPRPFDLNDFAIPYATTTEYRNRVVQTPYRPVSATERSYVTCFDVCDKVPRNRLCDMAQQTIGNLSSGGPFSTDLLVSAVEENLREYYDLPEKARPLIANLVRSQTLETLLAPVFLVELRTSLARSLGVDLQPRDAAPPPTLMWRHFVQTITVKLDGSQWLIRRGLDRSKIGLYFGAEPY